LFNFHANAWVPESDLGIIFFFIPNPADEMFFVAVFAKGQNSWGNQLNSVTRLVSD